MWKKCRPEDMILFDLDYGELLRPPFEILRDRGRGQRTNASGKPLLVYGPKHERDQSIFDTSLYVLNPRLTEHYPRWQVPPSHVLLRSVVQVT